jgi:hypothetical protein
MRKLKFHEQKLLKKVDFLRWKNEHNLRELQARSPRGCRFPAALLALQRCAPGLQACWLQLSAALHR